MKDLVSMKQKGRTQNSIINISTSFASQIVMTVLSFVTRTIFIKTLDASYLNIKKRNLDSIMHYYDRSIYYLDMMKPLNERIKNLNGILTELTKST